MSIINTVVVKKILTSIIVVVALILTTTNSAYAVNYNTSIFSDAQRYADSNSYKNENYSFSIQPPINWSVLRNLPSSVSNNALVVFSNNDKSQLATFGIYHRSIDQNVIDAIASHSDNDVLATIVQEMSAPSQDSKTIVYNGTIDRYTDGTRVTINSVTQYTTDNSTSLSENIVYFLNNGNQYTLSLTSKEESINKNAQLFEDSANTFLVSKTNTIPEFPTSFIILIIAMFSIITISKLKNIKVVPE